MLAENQQLRQELKDTIENQLTAAGGPVNTSTGDQGIDAVDNLQQQMANIQKVRHCGV